ncbi:MAG: GMC family oxidoreductase N-terminal domain-containing protein, partial [Aeromicrobium sp.]
MIVDYVIVGAGAAGCVLANRLSADPAVSVLLVEDGGRGRNPLLSVPRAFYFTLRSDRYVHRYPTGPGPGAEVWTRGRGLGGSTIVNGMMYVRGAAADFDALEAAGNPGWGSEAFLRAYRLLEDQQHVSIRDEEDDISTALLDGAAELGLRRTDDFNDSDDERIGFTPATIHRGRRVSAASAFLAPARRRPNLTIWTNARAEKILLRNRRAAGLLVRRGQRHEEVDVRREVLVAAGTVESPLLLERSGIGSPDVLQKAALVTLVESPNVGERVIEQRAVSMQVRFRDRRGPTESLNTLPKQALEGVRYLATRRGPVATSGYDIVSAFRSSPDVDRPDAQGVWVPMAIDESSGHMRLAGYSGLLFTGYALRPTTTSSIHVVSSHPEVAPAVSAHYLDDDAERATTGAILAHARSVVARSSLAREVEQEVFPGPAVSTPAEVVEYSRAHGGGIYHAVGSCAMGPDASD